MRVAFIYPACQPTDGGVYAFCQTVAKQLKEVKTTHEFKFIRYGSPLEDLDFVWFLTPHHTATRLPFAVTVWDLAHRILPYFPEFSVTGWTYQQREDFYSGVLPRATYVAVGSQSLCSAVQQFYNVRRSRILINPLPMPTSFDDIQAVEPAYRKPYLLYPACFWPHKNHVTIIDALKILAAKGEHYTAVFPGADKGNLDYIKRYAEGLPVHFPGFVSQEELKGLYQRAHALVYASLLGPDNLPPLEAIKLGCPVICANYVGAFAQLSHAALYFEELNAEELAERIPLAKAKKYYASRRDNYAQVIVKALDQFAPVRRLWGESYQHT